MSADRIRVPERTLPVRRFDVVVAGGGTAGVIAAVAAARTGARTALVEAKGYAGGIAVEGGTALHSFFNLWKAFPGVAKRQVVAGIPAELVERLAKIGGTTGHAEMARGFDYDSVCTAIDTELYKLVAMEMIEEAGVTAMYDTRVTAALVEECRVTHAIISSRSGEEALEAAAFVDSTGYGDLAAAAGASFTEPNDHPVANSIGVGGVSVEGYHDFLQSHGALRELAMGVRSGEENRIVRLHANGSALPQEFLRRARAIGMAEVITTVHDDYFMFVKLNLRTLKSPTDRDTVSKAELELRRRQYRAIELIREFIPGCTKAFVARSSPMLCIRRGRCVVCDYDISRPDVLEAKHFDDDVAAYGFHDSAPRLQIKGGDTYGIPWRALIVAGLENLLAAGMLITSDFDAHMSTRNTVCCMAQGQAAGTAAALEAGDAPHRSDTKPAHGAQGVRALAYPSLRKRLLSDGVLLEGGIDA